MQVQLTAIIILLLLSAVFSATETAYTSLSFVQLKTLENRRKRSSRVAYKLSQNRDALLTTVLVGNNVVNISVSALVTTFAIEYFSSQAVGYATGLLTLVILIFGEITPKQLALTHNMKIAVFMAYPIRFISIVLFPVVWLLRQFSSLITRLFASHAEPAITTEGVMHMVDAAEDEGLVDQYESDLMQRAIHFSETQVRTIMTHRTNVFCISDELTIRDAFPSIVKSGFSRVPVFHGSAENIIGIVLVRDILRAQLEKRMDKSISTILRKPIFVPEQMHLDDVFFLFKKDKLQQAIVLDEYGGFSGVVTMEDVAEQLFGELYDEHERRFPDRIVEREQMPGTFLVMADTPFQQFIDELDLSADHQRQRISTVAAYVLELTGDIPQEGDVVQSPLGTFRIISMKGNRMEAVEFSPTIDDGTLL
ncbi:MAG: hemolysin family protein [Sphaerochaeta sp.]|jgi:putative hemolysin|uniref:Magnesium and cobalt efflux protein CorC n=1 Tax=bioreactor metagenome TaxID=1076179 RepID=A0A644W190_9ZZZZ|nr:MULTISPECIES: hemolysin family protein [Sphaerochaeta]MDD2395618.1 hemolysin family protein [Sphaerochaeta sp.]MDD3423852.1 hemolysin family protein [Sphaerochaeta sp.]MDD4037111.1 hemolysin family protein [Sphaerochaeta sp.]MDX9982784.1 hemolysin family protein [Sphaerochaeta sp.]MEA5030021.1 hemolysin family protein [Sphaerochaeta associata]